MIAVRYSRQAKADIHQERNYYAAIRPALGSRFLTAVEEAVALLAQQPRAMQIVGNQVRRWPLAGFPHGVLYRVEAERIFILAVFHPRQHPARWQQRTE